MPTSLPSLLKTNQVALELPANDQASSLGHLVKLLSSAGKLADPAAFLQQLLARERLRPSAVEHGVALPHLRTNLVDNIVLAIGRSPAGVPFADGELAHLIFLIGVPQRLANEYLVYVGALARLLRDQSVRAALLRAKTVDRFLDILKNRP